MFIIVLLAISAAIGVLLRKAGLGRGAAFVERLSGYTVYLMLFVFGVTVGANREIVEEFHRLGFMAVVLAVAGIAGSMSLTWIVFSVILKRGKKG